MIFRLERSHQRLMSLPLTNDLAKTSKDIKSKPMVEISKAFYIRSELMVMYEYQRKKDHQ